MTDMYAFKALLLTTIVNLFSAPSSVYNIEGLIQQSFYHVR